MRNIFIGILIGIILTAVSGVAYARAKGIVLVSGNGNALGTASNPLYITS